MVALVEVDGEGQKGGRGKEWHCNKGVRCGSSEVDGGGSNLPGGNVTEATGWAL